MSDDLTDEIKYANDPVPDIDEVIHFRKGNSQTDKVMEYLSKQPDTLIPRMLDRINNYKSNSKTDNENCFYLSDNQAQTKYLVKNSYTPTEYKPLTMLDTLKLFDSLIAEPLNEADNDNSFGKGGL